MPSQLPLVSVVILNYNRAALTCALLSSFREYCSYPLVELILVDNASAEDPGPSCKQVCPELQVIYSNVNRGYAGGMNLGLKKAAGDLVLLLNNDVIIRSEIIGPMISVIAEHPDAGMVSPLIMQGREPEVIAYAGYTRIGGITGRNRAIGHNSHDTGAYLRVVPTAYAHGAAMMVSRKALLEVGPMPEDYFLYYEEIDWSERFRKAGYGIYVQPAAKIWHMGAATTGEHSRLKTYFLCRNRIVFMKRNRTVWQYRLFVVFFLLVSLPLHLARLLFSGRAEELSAYWKGLSDGLGGRMSTPEWLVESVVGKG